MLLKCATFAAAVCAFAFSAVAQNADGVDEWDEFRRDKMVADAEGFCNPQAADNIFVQQDAKAWRNEFRLNCWWPVFERRSRYFIKTYDWGSKPMGLSFSRDAPPSSPPVEVWVRGQHEGDKSVPYRRSLTLYRFTCAQGTNRYAAVQFVAYDANGETVEQWERSAAASKAAVPGSKEEAFADAVCRN
jgi:hypothetical protein